jgi:hypothetical protein
VSMSGDPCTGCTASDHAELGALRDGFSNDSMANG